MRSLRKIRVNLYYYRRTPQPHAGARCYHFQRVSPASHPPERTTPTRCKPGRASVASRLTEVASRTPATGAATSSRKEGDWYALERKSRNCEAKNNNIGLKYDLSKVRQNTSTAAAEAVTGRVGRGRARRGMPGKQLPRRWTSSQARSFSARNLFLKYEWDRTSPLHCDSSFTVTRKSSICVMPQSRGDRCFNSHFCIVDFSPLTTFLEPQSRFGGKPFKFQVVCPQNGTAVPKGLKPHMNQKLSTSKTVPTVRVVGKGQFWA